MQDTREQWQQVAADSSGVREFGAQMKLDEKGVALLTRFFQQAYDSQVTPANKVVQLRGVDICVKNPGRARQAGPVGVDIKGDGKTSGNMTLEICSQDRPNFKREGTAPGWPFKDMPMVAYTFLHTGDLLMLDMLALFPWLQDYLTRVLSATAQDKAAPKLTPRTWVTAAPNKHYLSYNLVVPIDDLIRFAPGVTCFNIAEFIGADVFAELMGKAPEPSLINTPVNTLEAFEHLGRRLLEAPCYDVKPQCSAQDMERLLRWMESVVRFAGREEVKAAGEAMKASRPRLALPEDES